MEMYCGMEMYIEFVQTPSPVALPPFSIEITKGDERLCFHLELVEAEQPGECTSFIIN